jgi:hypothetical protein
MLSHHSIHQIAFTRYGFMKLNPPLSNIYLETSTFMRALSGFYIKDKVPFAKSSSSQDQVRSFASSTHISRQYLSDVTSNNPTSASRSSKVNKKRNSGKSRVITPDMIPNPAMEDIEKANLLESELLLLKKQLHAINQDENNREAIDKLEVQIALKVVEIEQFEQVYASVVHFVLVISYFQFLPFIIHAYFVK